MKVTMSAYLEDKKVLAKQLVNRLSEDYAYVSILGVDTKGKKYSVKKTGIELNDSHWVERGFVVRVYNGKGYTEHSFNELEKESIEKLILTIKTTVDHLSVLAEDSTFEAIEYKVIEEAVIEENFLSEVEFEISDISHEEKVQKLRSLMEKTLELSSELVDVRVQYEDVHISKIFISTKKNLAQSYVWSNASVVPIASRDGRYKYFPSMISGLKGPELLDELFEVNEEAVVGTVSLLDSTNVEAGEYDIIMDPDMAGLVAHEAFGHGVEMDMFVKNRAKAAEYIDKEVASEYVNMFDGAKSFDEVSSYLFDDEGNLGTSTKIIDKGILKSGITDALSAMQLGVEPTGNGKRESFEHKTYTRMTNTFFDKGTHTLGEMIASIDHGYLLEGFSSGMEDPKNWGIQCVAALAKEIVNGKLTGKVYSPIYLTGYVPDLLKSITMASKDLKVIGNGTCGKGYKEWVKTATGGPYIKARGRLS